MHSPCRSSTARRVLLLLLAALAPSGVGRAQTDPGLSEGLLVQAVAAARGSVLPLLVHRHRSSSPEHQDCKYRIATAVALEPSGLFVSSAAVALDGAQFELVVGQQRIAATLLGADPLSGLSVLRLEGAAGQAGLSAGEPDALSAGQFVIVLGYSGSLVPQITLGIAGGVGESIYAGRLGRFLQFTPLGPLPEHGGAVLDGRGRMLALYAGEPHRGSSPRTTGAELPAHELMGASPMRIALPDADARAIAREIAEHGLVRRRWLGVTVDGPNLQLGAIVGLDREAALRVARVEPGSPGAQAGVRPGDRILSFGGAPVTSLPELVQRIERAEIFQQVPLRVERGGTPLDLSIRIGEREGFSCLTPSLEWLGLRLANCRSQGAGPSDAQSPGGGVLVSEVLNPALANWLGLTTGDRLVSINGAPVEDVSQFEGLGWLPPHGQKVTLGLLRHDSPLELQFSPLEVRTDPGALLLRLLRLEQGLERLLEAGADGGAGSGQ
jgi:S1-C subfamily serine protease